MTMTFDEYWEDYCARTGHPFAEGRAEAEEHWDAARAEGNQ